MRKLICSVAVVATMLLAGCGTTGSALAGLGTAMAGSSNAPANTTPANTATSTTSSTSGLASLIGNVLGTVLGNSSKFTEADLVGTWTYQSADCVFESENFLMKAGGEVAASKIEAKVNETVAKMGITAGKCQFVFNSDKTYQVNVNGRAIMSGQYALDVDSKKLTMTYLAGIATLTPNVVKNGNTISILYEADKLLAMAQKLAALSGNNSLQALSSLASSYDGMMVGLELKK